MKNIILKKSEKMILDKLLINIYPIYKLKKIDDLKIEFNKKELSITNNNEFDIYFKKRDNIIKILEEENKNKSLYEKIISVYHLDRNSLFKIFTGYEDYHYIDFEENKISKNNLLYKNILISTKRKVDKFLPYYFNTKLYVDDCLKKQINILTSLYLNLEKDGNVIFYYCYPSYEYIKFYYLCNILFEEVYLLFRNIIVCKKFKNDIINLKYLTEIIQNNYQYTFSKKIDNKKIFDFLKMHIEYDLLIKKMLIINKNKDIYDLYWLNLYNALNVLGLNLLSSHNQKEVLKIEKKINYDELKNVQKENYLNNLFEKKNIKYFLLILHINKF
jgi:hypothetical protein